MDSVSLREYSLWLMPEGEEAGVIKSFFTGIRKSINTIAFEPHVTLLGGLTLSEPQILERIDKLAAKTASFKISFIEAGETEDFYKSVFLKCEETKELMETNKRVQKLFSTNNLYVPHMSIVYGPIDSGIKKQILSSIDSLKTQSFAFNVNSIFLCKAFGTVDQWKIIHRLSLLG